MRPIDKQRLAFQQVPIDCPGVALSVGRLPIAGCPGFLRYCRPGRRIDRFYADFHLSHIAFVEIAAIRGRIGKKIGSSPLID